MHIIPFSGARLSPTTIPEMGLYKLAENFKQERKKLCQEK